MRHCDECGAPLEDGRECREYFYDLLVLESQVPGGPGRLEHFFAVATYNLQHPSQFVPSVVLGLRVAVADALAGRANVDELRKRAGAGAKGATRVLRRPGDPESPDAAALGDWPSTWPMTVRAVCAIPVTEYAERVRSWAASVTATLNERVPERRALR